MGLKNNKKGNIFESNQKLLEQRLKLADPFFYDKISTLLMSRGKKTKFRMKIAKGFKTVLRSQSSKMRLKDFFTLNIFKVRPLIFFRVKKLRRRTRKMSNNSSIASPSRNNLRITKRNTLSI